MLGQEAEEDALGSLAQLWKEWGSGYEDVPGEEGATESGSALDVADKALQCPMEEDMIKLVESPGYKTSTHYLIVKEAKTFAEAQVSGSWC